MATVAVRDWLKQQGIPESQIGWQDNQVTVGGKSFYKPTEVREGRSYASPEALQSALTALQCGGQNLARAAANITTFGGTQKAPAGTVPVRQYLTARGYSPAEIGWQDNTVTLGGSGYGITPSAVIEGRSYAPRSVVEAALKAAGFRTPAEEKAAAREKQVEDWISQMAKTVSQPFSYNPEEDPRFQAARKLQEAEAEQAGRRALEELNARGIANSTIAIDRLGQIQQRAAQNVYSMIPGLYQAALQERQAQLGNIGTLVSTLMGLQQAAQSQEQAEWQRQLQEAGLTGEYMGTPTWQAAQAEQALERQAALDALARRQAIAALTGIDPETGRPTWERQYAQEQLGLERSRLSQAAAKAAQPKESDIIRENLADAQSEIWNMLNKGVPLDQVEAWIFKNAKKYTSGGLKLSDLVDYAWMAATGYPKPKQEEEW